MQKQACSYRKDVYNIFTKIIRSTQELSISFCGNIISLSQANDNIIIYLPMSKQVKNIDNKMIVLEIPINESNLAIIVDYFIKK